MHRRPPSPRRSRLAAIPHIGMPKFDELKDMSKVAFKIAFETPFRQVLPKRLKNVIYRHYIEQLRRQAVKQVQPDCILATPPIPCDRTSNLKVWIPTSARDAPMALWALKSLLHYSRASWDVWLADGGLARKHAELFEKHFPNIRVLHRNELDERTRRALDGFPHTYYLRQQRDYAPARKLVDPPLYLSQRFLLLDSDVLFFSNPKEILAALADHRVPFHFNMERGSINSGVAVVDPQAVRLGDIESYLSSISGRQRDGWTIEQDIYTALAKDRFTPLPSHNAVEPISEAEHLHVTCCHYIGVARHRFYQRGIRRLRLQRFLGVPAEIHQSYDATGQVG